jgi:hypothetical protein
MSIFWGNFADMILGDASGGRGLWEFSNGLLWKF